MSDDRDRRTAPDGLGPRGQSQPTVLDGTLLVISHKLHHRLPGGGYATTGGFAKLKTVFGQFCSQIRLCVPVIAGADEAMDAGYPSNLTVCPLPYYRTRAGFLAKLPRIVRILWTEAGRADMVYAMCPNDMGLLGLLIARLRRTPVFISIDTDRAHRALIRTGGTFLGRVKAWLVRQTVYRFLRALAGNLPGYVTGDAFLGDRPRWRQWIKTTVTRDELPPMQEPPAGPLPKIHAVFAGRLSPEKNIECLIDAARRLVQDGFAVTVSIVGNGSSRSRLEAYAEGAPVQFRGFVANDVLRSSHFLGADVLVLPSREERQGKVLLEAMAASVPVIGARAGGIPSVVTHERHGLLFDPDRPEELAARMARVANDSQLRQRLVHEGYALAKAYTLDFTISSILREVIEFYEFPHRRAHATVLPEDGQ